MSEKKLSREEVAIELPPPWLIYAKQLTKEEIQSLIDGKAIELNLYVVNDTHIRVTLFGDSDEDIEEVVKSNRSYPMKGSWFK